MKRIILLLSLIGTIADMSAQGLPPSTVRQVFSLQKGDSLEYHVWNVGACSPSCNYYILKVVDSISSNLAQDTLNIFFQTQILHFDSSGPPSISSCGECHTYFMGEDICPVASDQWTFEHPDSSIIFFIDPNYDTLCQACFLSDSIYKDSTVYENRKQNLLIYGAGFDGMTDVYADSIGLIYKAEDQELASNNREQLIYYHKANGAIWGTPSYYTGISDVSGGNNITIYPNPAGDEFTIHTDQYQGLHFELFDMLSEKVMTLDLSESETQVSRNNLQSGIYFWQITDRNNKIKTGKLILE